METNRTLDDYKRAGAYMRLLKAVLAETHVACGKVLRAKETDKFNTISRKVDAVCSDTEENMFYDYPQLDSRYCSVFYGSPDHGYRDDIDMEQIKLMIELVKELFKDNWK